MRIAVIGAGIVGVTTAYELAAEGHEVTVYERHASVAAEASFANAGVLAPGYVTPWAAPGMPWKVLRHLLSRHAPVRLGGWHALGEMPWMWRWWRACSQARYEANRAAMQRLAHFSRSRQLELTRALDLEYEQSQGYLVLLRGAREVKLARAGLKLLAELGVPFELIDGERARRIEPGLNADTALQAAIHLAQDGVGNCRQFAHLLKAQAQRLGVDFQFGREVLQIVPGTHPNLLLRGQGQDGEAQSQSPEPFDAVIVCAGHLANGLLAPLGLRLPMAPIYGYSVTAPLRHLDPALPSGPRSALMDERFKVAITRLGQRIRVAGSAEIGGSSTRFNAATLDTLYRVLDDWFPGAAATAQAQQWKGARPMLTDGPPVLGASGVDGVWLNAGHGSSGWALACGSARVLADAVARRQPPIDLARLQLSRLR